VSGFEERYREASPAPWDIGRPQPEVVRLEEARRIEGSVLDVGCGTGENALFLASRGHPVVGVDAAPTALARAREKATARRLGVMFHLADALRLDPHLGTFRTILDCGLFHTFPDDARAAYAESLGRLAHRGGRLFVLTFSEREPGDWGPRRIREEEFGPAFSPHWRLVEVQRARFDTNTEGGQVHAWLAELHRT
jgi:SAM-dependent methyltransferase